jgi:hypothetical protein
MVTMAWLDIFAFRVVLFTLCLSVDVDKPKQATSFGCLFPPCHTKYVFFEQRSWCGTSAVEGKETGHDGSFPSLVHAATVQHSISLKSFRLNGYLLGCHNPNQINMFPLISSSTPNQPSPSLVLLPVCLRAAQPPILSSCRFEISTFPLIKFSLER